MVRDRTAKAVTATPGSSVWESEKNGRRVQGIGGEGVGKSPFAFCGIEGTTPSPLALELALGRAYAILGH